MTLAVPAFAQTTTATTPPASPPDAAAPTAGALGGGAAVTEVVVTGSMLRRKLAATDAPLTVVTAADLDVRGITTVADGVQMISANSAGSLPNSFTANGAFAAGASAASLRGLTTNSTLTLIDGLRTAYYPLADDGTRNFVDLNTIPDVIVDRIETLKDGASSAYGADAIAGVVNVITKKTYQGVMLKAEGGLAQRAGGGENNYQLLMGKGDLQSDGYNVYLGLEYEHDDALYNRQRGFPYNTSDLSSLCGVSLAGGTTCRTNAVGNGIQADGSFQGVGATAVAIVRPYSLGGRPLGDFQMLNPAAGCGGLKTVTVTPAQAAAGGAAGINNGPVTLCQEDYIKNSGMISPDDKRFSASFRATKTLGEKAQVYVALNYYQNDVMSSSSSSNIRQTSTPGALGLVYHTNGSPGITLPVYICASGTNCSAANGTLNPNNPFASLGEVAGIRYSFDDIPFKNEQFSQTYRMTGGITGAFDLWGSWDYSVDATGAQTDLANTTRGAIYIANLLSAVATGAYNFVTPSANTQTVRNFISPENVQNSTSKLYMVQGNLTRSVYDLPGGPLQLGLSAAARYESVFNPSANPDDNGATNRYFSINPFGTIGSRDTESFSFELDAPVVKQLERDSFRRNHIPS